MNLKGVPEVKTVGESTIVAGNPFDVEEIKKAIQANDANIIVAEKPINVP